MVWRVRELCKWSEVRERERARLREKREREREGGRER